jgi:tetratricopeptide (TPR) repeat protein
MSRRAATRQQTNVRRTVPITFFSGTEMSHTLPDIMPYTVRERMHAGLGARTLLVAGLLGALACSDLSKPSLPVGVSDPNVYHTPEGALQLYTRAIYTFTGASSVNGFAGNTQETDINGAFASFVLTSGLLTDELQAGNLGGSETIYSEPKAISLEDSLDARLFSEAPRVYTTLQNVRGASMLAIATLDAYAPTASSALRGHLYALEGYAELALADLYCSGVPLSTVDFNADFTYHAGSTTAAVYEHALALLDTAVTLSADSARILNFARVGKGRALLALGRYAEAAQAVTEVPTTYKYAFYVNWGDQGNGSTTLFQYNGPILLHTSTVTGKTVADVDGINGLPYVSSGDPRSASLQFGVNSFDVPQYAPLKYESTASADTVPTLARLVVASGVEARLIEAEAEYHGVATGLGNWLDELNALRQTAVTPALPLLGDPGNDAARVDLLFQERAYWLFLTGVRQGDLRRLVRNYQRDPETVYPTGAYPIGAQLPRGSRVSLSIPRDEYRNPKFTGCLS